MFEKVTPESVGVASEKLLDFIKLFDNTRMNTHGFIMMKGDKIIAESYYKPFGENFLHRMYSVSKTFISMAVGVAVTEGLITLDDVVTDYFPEFRNEKTDELYDECTIRDILCMSSNIGHFTSWWGVFQSRVEAYYSLESDKIPGTLFTYDSMGSFLLGCIIEKLTGKTFLEYLKEKVLLEIGFSKESYTLYEPGGFTVGDSGVMCTLKDLAIFARFIMNKGNWNGKQYIDKAYMEEATKIQTYNNLTPSYENYGTGGYGYLLWITHENGFSLTGLGDQLAICDMNSDILFVLNADNQCEKATRHVIYHEFINHFLPSVKKNSIEENKTSYKELCEYTKSRELICQKGFKNSSISEKISGAVYEIRENSMNFSSLSLCLKDNEGAFEMVKSGRKFTLDFGICKNKFNKFSFGDVPVADMMGKNKEGQYNCAVSGAWVDDKTFVIYTQVIDTYFGCLKIVIGFKDERISVSFKRSGQYVFEDIDGFVVGKMIKE